jgi:hypothetical protein
MAKTITNGSREGFLLGINSKFQVKNSKKIPYYIITKHTRGTRTFQDTFISSFNSEINPNLLPGFSGVSDVVILDKLILTEFDSPITTEIGDYLLIEP